MAQKRVLHDFFGIGSIAQLKPGEAQADRVVAGNQLIERRTVSGQRRGDQRFVWSLHIIADNTK
jgi:hypothetical protein